MLSSLTVTGSELSSPLLYGKAGLAFTDLEVVSVGSGICGGTGYTVEEIAQTPTFSVAVLNTSYSVGQTIHVYSGAGSSGCTPLPNKYSLIPE